jgi:hypothetical protein
MARQGGAESHADEPAHLRDTARKSLVYVQFIFFNLITND